MRNERPPTGLDYPTNLTIAHIVVVVAINFDKSLWRTIICSCRDMPRLYAFVIQEALKWHRTDILLQRASRKQCGPSSKNAQATSRFRSPILQSAYAMPSAISR